MGEEIVFIRADIHDAALARVKALEAEIAQLRDALQMIAVIGYSDDVRVSSRIAVMAVEQARAALANP